MAQTYTVCGSCCTAMTNADTSAMDEDALEIFEKFCDNAGYLVHIGPANESGNFDCPACEESVYEHGELMETLD